MKCRWFVERLPEKEALSLRKFFSMNSVFSRFMNLLGDIIAVSLLWLLCSIPLITLGAASTAAYYTAAKCIRHKNGTIFASFFHAFKTNLKQSVGITVLYALLLIVLLLDCAYFYGNGSDLGLLALYFFYFLILVWLCSLSYACAWLSRFWVKTMHLFRMSLVLVFRHLKTTVLLLVLLLAGALGIWLMPWSILLLPGAIALTQTFLLEPLLRKYAPAAPEGSAEAAKWYNQS